MRHAVHGAVICGCGGGWLEGFRVFWPFVRRVRVFSGGL